MRLSRDGAPVVMHDATLERTTGLTGPVRARTLAELRTADAGHWFTPDGGRTMPCRDQGVRIPTLAEVLWAFPAMPVLIEVKEPEVQEAVRRVLVDEQRVRALRGGVGGRRGARRCSATARFPAAPRHGRSRELYRAVLLRRRLPAAAVPAAERADPAPGAPGADAAASWPRRGGSDVRCTSGP